MADQISIEIHGLRFDAQGYKRQLRMNCQKAQRMVALEFIRHMMERIPVWSGAAQATLIPLAEEVGINVGIPNKPIVSNRVDDEHGVAAGIQHGHAKVTETGFTFYQDLRHFDLLDPEVWHALDTAEPVLKAFIRNNIRKIVPNMHSHIKKETI